MFNNIGSKIKALATVLTYIGFTISALYVFVSLATIIDLASRTSADAMLWPFLITIFISALIALASWLGSFLLYGFGELIDNSAKTTALLSQIVHNPEINKNGFPADRTSSNCFDDISVPTINTFSNIWQCSCGKYINSSPCRFCGKDYSSSQTENNSAV